MKGLFIPEITAKMFRNGCLESIEALMAEGEIYDIDYPSINDAHNEGYDVGYWAGRRDYEPKWIPVSERLPEESGEYLVRPSDGVLENYSDFSEVMIMPYDADCEAFGWWHEKYDPVSLGYLDSDFEDFEVLAWMPLPKPYKEKENGR